MRKNANVSIQAQRPRWWRPTPDLWVEARADAHGYPDLVQTVLAAARRLYPGQTLSFEVDYQPELLFLVLAQKGFEHWTEPAADGKWRVDFHI